MSAVSPSVDGDDGLVDAVGGVVGELDQQQQLREGVVLAGHALGQPALGDAEQLREEPGLDVAVVVAEVLLQRQLGQQEGDLCSPAALQVVEGVDARSRRRWARSRSWWACRRWRAPAASRR